MGFLSFCFFWWLLWVESVGENELRGEAFLCWGYLMVVFC